MFYALPIYVVIFFFLCWLFMCIRIINPDQRVAIIRLGRFEGLKGPGLIFAFSPIDKDVKLSLSDEVKVVDASLASFKGISIPYKSETSLTIGHPASIIGFESSCLLLSPATNSNFAVMCPKCGHRFSA